MYETIKFLFSGFWLWLGGLIYLAVIAAGITGLVRITVKQKLTNDDKETRDEH